MAQQLKQDRPLRVLVVDDEPDIRAELHDALEMTGYVTCSAASYGEAHACLLAIWEQDLQGLDVVILDVRLPDGDGLQLVEDIFQLWPAKQQRPVVICLSGDYSAAVINRALAAGAAGYVAKPASIREITGYIGEALSLSVRHP